MSILIKGMEMPESCLYCPCHEAVLNLCQATVSFLIDEGERPDNCPLVEVKTMDEEG